MLVDRDAVIRGKKAKGEHRDDLSRETCDREICPDIQDGDVATSGGDGATNCL